MIGYITAFILGWIFCYSTVFLVKAFRDGYTGD